MTNKIKQRIEELEKAIKIYEEKREDAYQEYRKTKNGSWYTNYARFSVEIDCRKKEIEFLKSLLNEEQ
jgi:hypothetical protein